MTLKRYAKGGSHTFFHLRCKVVGSHSLEHGVHHDLLVPTFFFPAPRSHSFAQGGEVAFTQRGLVLELGPQHRIQNGIEPAAKV